MMELIKESINLFIRSIRQDLVLGSKPTMQTTGDYL